MKTPALETAVRPPVHLHGLLAWLKNTRVALPLKGVETTFSVRGDLAMVQLDQIYHQDRDQVLDVTYTFPLPSGTAVYRCELHVNGRIISARVEELEEARRIAAEKKAAGHRTALVETVRENLFELELGNLAPGDTVIIRLCWIDCLERLGGEWSLRVPFCPGIRYVPGKPLLRRNAGRGTADDTDAVPDASRLSPPRMDTLHPDAAYVSIEGTVDAATADAASLASPSHTLVLRESKGLVRVLLGDRAAVPDRDFVLRGRDVATGELKQAAWICEDEHGCHALVRAVAPAQMESSADAAQDVYFLVDRSGSMAGVKWTATCKALRAFLTNLAPQDRTWITWFESSWQDMAERPLPPAALLAEPAMQNLEQWGTGGGTELLPALTHVLEVMDERSRNRRVVTVLITDGQVGNEAQVLHLMKKHPAQRVFTFGIDTVVNDAFLKRLAVQQRGSCHLATPEEDIVSPIAALAMRLRRPVLTDLQPGPGWEFPAGAPPDLLAGEAVSLVLRRTGPAALLTYSGARADGERLTISPDQRPESLSGIALLWARRRIDALLEDGKKDEAVTLAKDANLICEGAAFIAWDEAERIAVKGTALPVYQPAMEPAQWVMPGNVLKAASPVTRAMPLPSFIMAPPPAPAQPARAELREETGVYRGGKKRKSAPPDCGKNIPPKEYCDVEFDACPELDGSPAANVQSALRLLSAVMPTTGKQWTDTLFGWIEQWLLSDPGLQLERVEALYGLAFELQALPEDQRTTRLEQWLAETFNGQPAFLRGCLAGIAG